MIKVIDVEVNHKYLLFLFSISAVIINNQVGIAAAENSSVSFILK